MILGLLVGAYAVGFLVFLGIFGLCWMLEQKQNNWNEFPIVILGSLFWPIVLIWWLFDLWMGE